MVTQLADKIGRKRTVQLSGLIWVIGSILQCASIVCSLPVRDSDFSLKTP